MQEMIKQAVSYLTTMLYQCGPFGGVVLVLLESIFPVLPLALFIALNILTFGDFFGFVISWLATIGGCLLSYFFFFYIVEGHFEKFIKKREMDRVSNMIAKIGKIPFSHLVLLIALPFTPAFLVNIAAALSKIPLKKFLIALFIGKTSIVYFWGYVGTSLLESFTDIMVIIKVGLLLVLAFFLSKFLEKKLHV